MSNALLDDSGSAAPRSAGSALLNQIPQKVLAIADQGVVSGGTFLATVAVARWADAHQLGAYSLGMSGLFTIMGIQEALIALPYMIRRNRPEAEAVGLAGHSLVQSALLSAATAGSLVILALFLTAARSDSSLPAFVCALAWLAPFFLLREFVRQFCFAHMQFAQALAMDGSALLLQVSGLALVELVWGLSATSVCITNGLAFGLVGVRWFYLQRANFRMPILRLPQVLKENWSLGRWLLAAQIAASFQASIASWLLAIVDGTEAAGVYAACLAIVALSNPVIIGIANHLMPRTTVILRQEGVAALRPKLVRDAILLGTVVAGFCSVLAFASGGIAQLLYHGTTYVGHGYTIQLLALAFLAVAVGVPASNGLASLEKPYLTFSATLLGAVATTVLGFGLVNAWGVVGAACAFLVGTLIGTVGRWAAFLQATSSDRQHRGQPCDPTTRHGPPEYESDEIGTRSVGKRRQKRCFSQVSRILGMCGWSPP